MHDELSPRHQAIRMRFAGEPVPFICRTLKRSLARVHKVHSSSTKSKLQ